MLRLLSTLLALSFLYAPSSRASAIETVDKMVKAYGGEAALNSLRAVRMTGVVVSPSRGKGKLTRELEMPDRLRVNVQYEAAREVRLLDKAKAFQNGKPVAGVGADAMALQAWRLDLPGLFGRMRAKVVDLGPSEQAGVQVIGLRLALERGMELTAYVDPKTFTIVRTETSVGAAGERVTFASNYSDYRKVSGVLFAFAEDNFAGTMATGHTQLDKIELLPSLPAETWEPSPAR